VIFWHAWLVLGVLIDLAVVAAAVVRPGWTTSIGG